MRQALFAVVLVAASFAGGAVVNGPGLRWAQAMVLNRIGPADGGEGAAAVAPAPFAPAPGTPARPIALLAVEPSAADASVEPKKGRAVEPATAAPATAEREPARPKAELTLTPAPTPTPVPPPALATVPESVPPPLGPPPPLMTSRERESEAFALAAETAKGAVAAVDADDDKEKTRDASVRLVSRPEDSAAAAAAPTAEPGDWTEVRRAMRGLGVSRYGVDGEPGGRVRFHCVIPLAGRRAVGQHFEAEGDDDLQAARAALRRVALWRAAEAAPKAPAP